MGPLVLAHCIWSKSTVTAALWDLERVAFILWAAGEIVLIEDRMCGSKDCIGGAHKQKVALIARGNTNVSH